MIYSLQVLATILMVLVVSTDALRMMKVTMALSDYRAELAATAAKIAGPGEFLLCIVILITPYINGST